MLIKRALLSLLPFIMLLSLGGTLPINAQSSGATTGALVGTVTDTQGKIIVGATVKVRQLATNLERATRVEERGSYKILQLPPGDYAVTVQATGFSPVTAIITLNIGI